MKKIGMMLLLSLGLFTAANAQRHVGGGIRGGGNFYRGGSRVIVSAGPYFPMYYGMGAPYLGWGYGYGFGYPGPYYNNGYRYAPKPSKLDMQIDDIKHEYQQKINAARDDNSISGKERRATVRSLKNEREMAITQAKRDFYKSK
ncbi:hypothetical protein [Filimonas effusa]|uniref:Uncharacterized protein n=1 Tax=Filimonas effusa TaxID=2508721 RepID=A0A4Q1D625_9BACT|nr:hypothetical protein [Filimonas effusa]RXK83909.1 hypothetical protein ESB13_17720 [Filimonas effusa]